jgi:hypothetical protein
MFDKKITFIFAAILMLTLACQLGVSEDTPAPDLGPQQTMTSQAIELGAFQQQATVDAQLAAGVQGTIAAQGTADAQATSAANETAAAYNQKTKEAENNIATRTQARAILLTNTAEAEMEVEPQVGAFSEKLQVAYDDDVLPTMEGTYHRLEDFDESIAKTNRFYWWDTGYAPENFVIRVDAYWDTASEITNWDRSGCAFVFGIEDEDNYNFTWLGLDGFVNLQRVVKDDWQWIAKRQNGKLSIPEGEAEIMMVVFDKRITIYINGEKELSEFDPFYTAGDLALSVYSGTNKGFGTRCKMTNIDLMIFE